MWQEIVLICTRIYVSCTSFYVNANKKTKSTERWPVLNQWQLAQQYTTRKGSPSIQIYKCHGLFGRAFYFWYAIPLCFFLSRSHFQSEFHYVPVCMEIFSIISTFFAVVWILWVTKAKQTFLMISTHSACTSECASVFDGIWICNFFCLIVVPFPFFVHPYQKFDIQVEPNKLSKSERDRKIENERKKKANDVIRSRLTNRLSPSYFILCARWCSTYRSAFGQCAHCIRTTYVKKRKVNSSEQRQ